MKNGNPTLVILTPGFPEEESGTYLVLSQQLLVKTLKEQYPDWDIIVLSFFFPEQQMTRNWNGATLISFGGIRERKWKRFFLWRRILKKLKEVRASNNIAGVLSFWCGECALVGKRFAKKNSLKHYIWICGQDARSSNKWVRFIRPRANELLAMSPFLAEEFFRNHKIRPAYIIANGIEPDLFEVAPAGDRETDILGAGSLIPLKQYDLFVAIVEELVKRYPQIRAVLYGEGPEKEKLARIIEKRGMEKNLLLAGSCPHPELLKQMRQTKIFLHTSEYEGFSTVCLEALYAGAQVISFCYPLDQPVPNWQVVKDSKEMLEKTAEVLERKDRDHTPVLLYTIKDSAAMIMKLFSE